MTQISNIKKNKKKTVRLLFAPTWLIFLELLTLLLAETGIKYPCSTEIKKGAMITTTNDILAGSARLFIVFLDLPHNQIHLRMKAKIPANVQSLQKLCIALSEIAMEMFVL